MAAGNIFRVIAEALGIIAKRQELNNAEDMKEAAKHQQEQKALDERTKDVAAKNLEDTRREISDN